MAKGFLVWQDECPSFEAGVECPVCGVVTFAAQKDDDGWYTPLDRIICAGCATELEVPNAE